MKQIYKKILISAITTLFVVALCCTGAETALAALKNDGTLSVQNGQFAFSEDDFVKAVKWDPYFSIEYSESKDGLSGYSVKYAEEDTDLLLALEKDGETIEAINIMYTNVGDSYAMAIIIMKRIAGAMDSVIENVEDMDYLEKLVTNGEYQGEAVTVYDYVFEDGGIQRILPIPNASSSNLSMNSASNTEEKEYWIIKHYVDEFKNETKDIYIGNKNYIHGTFSNSATTDSDLTVILCIDKSLVRIQLFEYTKNIVKNPYSDDREYTTRVLLDGGYKATIKCRMPSDGQYIVFDEEGSLWLIEALKDNKEISFYIEEKEHTITNYSFMVECANFDKLYEEHETDPNF